MDFGRFVPLLVRHDPKLVNSTSVMQAVREEVGLDFSVQDAIARDYVNLSALSRMLKPKVEKRVGKKVGEEGLISSLKRMREDSTPASRKFGAVIAGSLVNVRTRVSRLSVERTRRTMKTVSELLAAYQEGFIQMSESVSAITLIFDQSLHREVKKALAGAEILEEGEDCAAITVHSPGEIITTPGCVSAFYDQLSRRQVNIEDTVSCFTDTIMVVSMKDVGKAFEALNELIETEKETLGSMKGTR
jgi:aspartokinase